MWINIYMIDCTTNKQQLVERWISWFLASLKVAANCEILVVWIARHLAYFGLRNALLTERICHFAVVLCEHCSALCWVCVVQYNLSLYTIHECVQVSAHHNTYNQTRMKIFIWDIQMCFISLITWSRAKRQHIIITTTTILLLSFPWSMLLLLFCYEESLKITHIHLYLIFYSSMHIS